MPDRKSQLFQDVSAAREALWASLDALDDATEIYPGWRKREFFAHVAGWEAMVFEIIYRQVSHQAPKDYGYTDADSANARYVAVRQSMTVQDARLECEINRFAILTLLADIDDLSEVIQLPWGPETVAEFIEDAIDHERGHMADLLKLGRPGMPSA